jgi:hypothetical protein
MMTFIEQDNIKIIFHGWTMENGAEWIWILKCKQCMKYVTFDNACVPTQRLAEWAKCCGEIMELESVLRSAADA